MRSSNPLHTNPTQTTPHQSHSTAPIPSIRLISATPSATGSASDASASFNRSLEEAWAALPPLAPKVQALDSEPTTKRKLVPKKSKLSLLGLGSGLSTNSNPSKDRAARDFSDVVRRVGASNAVDTSSSAFEIYIDPEVDEGAGEIVMVKKKKSRVALDGMRWGAADVTNVPKVTPPVPSNAGLLKVKAEEGSGRWWSIGRGRKDSKEKTKENKISYQPVEYIYNPEPRSKAPEPLKAADTRGRFNSLDSGILLNGPINMGPSANSNSNNMRASSPAPPVPAPVMMRSASVDVNAYLAAGNGAASANVHNTSTILNAEPSTYSRSATPTATYSRSATPTAGGLLAPPNANGNSGGGNGSIALRAIRSVRSIARMGSWAQLRNMPPPTAEEMAVADAEEAARGGKQKKEKDGKEKKEKTTKSKSKKENKTATEEETGNEKKAKKSKSSKSTKSAQSGKEDTKDKDGGLRPTSSSSFEIGALSSSPAPPGRFLAPQSQPPQVATLGPTKKRSILGLGLPSTMRLPTVRSGSTASSILNMAGPSPSINIGAPMPLGSNVNANRLSADSHQNVGSRPGSVLSSTGSSLRPLSTTSTGSRASSALSHHSGLSAISGVSGGSGSVRWDEEGLQTVREQRRRERAAERAAREGKDSNGGMDEDGMTRRDGRRSSKESKHSVEGRRRRAIGDVFPEVQTAVVQPVLSSATATAHPPPAEERKVADGDIVMASPVSTRTAPSERRRRAVSYPILTIEEATADGHCALRDDESIDEGSLEGMAMDDRVEGEEEVQGTPVKKARKRPLSEQLLGKSRPKPMYEDEEGVLSILDAATNDLALLINNLDLQATPSTPDLTPLRPSAVSTLEKNPYASKDHTAASDDILDGSPMLSRTLGRSRGRLAAESPLKKSSTNPACTLTSNASISSLRPYAQSRGYAPKASLNPAVAAASATVAAATIGGVTANAVASNNNAANAAIVAKQIAPWATLMQGLSPVKEGSKLKNFKANSNVNATATPPLSSSTFRPGHKRTMTPAPEPEPEPVFQPLRPARSRANTARLQAPAPIVTVQQHEKKIYDDMDLAELDRAPLSSLTFGGSISSMRSLTPVFKRISEDEKERSSTKKRSSLLPPPDFLNNLGTSSRGSSRSRASTPRSARSHNSKGSQGSTFSTANLSYSYYYRADDNGADEEDVAETRIPIARETRRVLGMSGTMGGSDVYDDGMEPDASDPDSDVPDELRSILQLTTGHRHSTSSRPTSPVESAFEVGLEEIGSAAMLGEVTMTAEIDVEALARAAAEAQASAPPLPHLPALPSLPSLPVFRASLIDDECNRYSITDSSSAYASSPARSSASEDDTKKSFDFTGELKKLNESGGSDRRSFVEQLENAFRTPAKVDLRYDFGVALPLPPVPALPLSVRAVAKVNVEFREAIEAESSSSSMSGSVSGRSDAGSVSRLVHVKQPSMFDSKTASRAEQETMQLGESKSHSRLFDMFDSADASRIVDIKEPTMLQGSDSLGNSDNTPEDSLFADEISSPGVGRGAFQRQHASPANSERPSEGVLDRSFRFGGLPSASSDPSPFKTDSDKPLTLSDIIPSPSHARSISLNGSFNLDDLELEDDSVMKSIHAHLINGTSVLDGLPAARPRPQTSANANNATNTKPTAAETLADKRRSIYKATSRPTSGISFEGFTSFDEVRRGFEFSDDRPAFYPPAVPKNAATTSNVGNNTRRSHRKHESAFSIASVSSYGHVISAGSLDPFDYGELRPLSEEEGSMDGCSVDVSSVSMSMEVEDTFAYRACQPLRPRARVDSDASSFYFRSAPLPSQQTRGHRRRESNMSVSSQAPPISLYNRSFGQHGHRRNDSSTSGVSAWARPQYQHRRDMSTDSMMSDFSVAGMQQLGRPGIGEKMFGDRLSMAMLDSANNTTDHGPLYAISASPPESASRPTFDHDEMTGYDSIMDGEQQSDERYSAEYSDSIFEQSRYDARFRDSMASDMVFEADYAQRYDQGRLQAPILFQLPNVADRTSVHSPMKEDDTMISMLGGGHVRRRSMEISPCARVEKRKHSAVLLYRDQAQYDESPNKARIVEKASIASTSSFQFGGERMIKAQRGLLERQSLEDSCLIADGEELAAACRSVPVFTRPTPATRSRSSTCTSSSGGDTPPLSASDGSSFSEGSQSSIDLSQINVALSNATHPMSTVSRARSRARAPGTGHRRRYSKSHVSRSSVYETIEEEMMSSHHGSPAQSLLSKKSSPTTRQAIYVVDSDTASINSPDETVWDDERGIMALRKYYALKDEAQNTVSESRRMWSDTPFSLFAIQSFQAPAEPAGMQALLAHSVQNYGPLPSELRPHRVRSRTSSRASPYPQARISKATLSPEQALRTANSNVTLQRTPVLKSKPVKSNANVMTTAPSLEALKPFSPLSFLHDEPKRENAFGLAPNARPRVGSNARRTALGWSKRSTGPGTGKSSTDQKENAVGTGISMTPRDNLRLNRPRPRGRPTPGGRTPASQNRAIRI